jgi:hypothetical protein
MIGGATPEISQLPRNGLPERFLLQPGQPGGDGTEQRADRLPLAEMLQGNLRHP